MCGATVCQNGFTATLGKRTRAKLAIFAQLDVSLHQEKWGETHIRASIATNIEYISGNTEHRLALRRKTAYATQMQRQPSSLVSGRVLADNRSPVLLRIGRMRDLFLKVQSHGRIAKTTTRQHPLRRGSSLHVAIVVEGPSFPFHAVVRLHIAKNNHDFGRSTHGVPMLVIF